MCALVILAVICYLAKRKPQLLAQWKLFWHQWIRSKAAAIVMAIVLAIVLGPLQLLCAAATEASAAAAPGGASTATLGLLGVALVFATAALLLLSPVLYLKLPPTMLGPQARAAERLILSLRLPPMPQP